MTLCRLFAAALSLALFTALPAAADHQYLALTEDGDLLASGPFDLRIPTPEGARIAKPRHTRTTFGMERIRTSRAAFVKDDRILIIEVETTDAPAGTISYEGMPLVKMAGLELPSRSDCLEISQAQLDVGDEPLFSLMKRAGFDPTPAMYARQLFLVNDDGTGEGIALYAKRVGSCAEVTAEFMEIFDAQFERFVQSVRDANPQPR
jgi:hypothetical protein